MEIISIPGFSEPFSSLTHLGSAALSAFGFYFLYQRGRGNSVRMTSLSIYTFSLVFLFSMSGVYHLLEPGGAARDVLQRLDHAGIWVLIAGTFTPLHIILFRGAWRWAVLTLVWVVAITGLVLEVVFFKEFPGWLSLTLYLGLGWVGALSGYKFKNSFGHHSLKFLILGGVFYSVGAIIDFLNKPILIPGVLGPHEIFHLLVTAAAWMHWQFIFQWASHPVSNQILFHVRVFNETHFIAHAFGEHINVEANTRDQLRAVIREKVAAKYHPSIAPKIHLQYSQEEYLSHTNLS